MSKEENHCCGKGMACYYLDGRLQDIPDIDPGELNPKNHIKIVVQTAFYGEGKKKQEALKEVGRLISSSCYFEKSLVSKSISECTGFNSKNHRTPS